MARPRYPKSAGPVPAPLPPVARTVGQLVAETLKTYGDHWRAALVIGAGPAILNVLVTDLSGTPRLIVSAGAGSVAATVAFILASAVVTGSRLRVRAFLTAAVAGVLIYLPFVVLVQLYILPGIAWFALVGLAVPAAVAESLGLRSAIRRGVELGRADYVHVLGGLATLTVLVFLTQFAVAMLLQGYADNSERIAGFLAGLVLSPLLFIGGALLYVDQTARVGTTRAERLAIRAAPPEAAQ